LSVTNATATLASYAYSLGAAGNRTGVVEASGRTVSYRYDSLYRLTSETISNDAAASGNGAIAYSFDVVGNRLTRTSTVAGIASQTFAYNGNDQLATDSYDANGSTTASGGNTYQYDFENHLVRL